MQQPAPPMGAAPAQQSAAPQSAAPQSSLSDPILQKIESGIQAKVAPQAQRMYMSCVNAGMAAMFGQQTGSKVMAKLKSSNNLMADIPAGIANIFATIYNEVGIQMQPQQRQMVFLPALLGASATLTCHAIDTAEKLGRIKVTPQIAAQAIHDAAMACLAKMKVGPKQIQQASAAGRQKQPSPASAAQAGAQPGAM